MPPETIRQIDLFSGDVVDNRTRAQKQADREREKPQQTEMFAQREIAQFGVRANPHLSLSEHTKLVLIREDPRSEEEIERVTVVGRRATEPAGRIDGCKGTGPAAVG